MTVKMNLLFGNIYQILGIDTQIFCKIPIYISLRSESMTELVSHAWHTVIPFVLPKDIGPSYLNLPSETDRSTSSETRLELRMLDLNQ